MKLRFLFGRFKKWYTCLQKKNKEKQTYDKERKGNIIQRQGYQKKNNCLLFVFFATSKSFFPALFSSNMIYYLGFINFPVSERATKMYLLCSPYIIDLRKWYWRKILRNAIQTVTHRSAVCFCCIFQVCIRSNKVHFLTAIYRRSAGVQIMERRSRHCNFI